MDDGKDAHKLSFLYTCNCIKLWKWYDEHKVNTDAAFFNDGSRAVAAIIRDSRGQAVAGLAESFIHAHDAAWTEALALGRGLQLVHTVGCSRVQMESNSLEIEACEEEKYIRAPYFVVLTHCFQVAHEISDLKF